MARSDYGTGRYWHVHRSVSISSFGGSSKQSRKLFKSLIYQDSFRRVQEQSIFLIYLFQRDNIFMSFSLWVLMTGKLSVNNVEFKNIYWPFQ
mmetsp:Transcript_32202/g.63757  ORF Transcript_32202/g.63757 Transcript_32202/m.63757 type:complete len:92 (-) Transcript_32202:134-409(-)